MRHYFTHVQSVWTAFSLTNASICGSCSSAALMPWNGAVLSRATLWDPKYRIRKKRKFRFQSKIGYHITYEVLSRHPLALGSGCSKRDARTKSYYVRHENHACAAAITGTRAVHFYTQFHREWLMEGNHAGGEGREEAKVMGEGRETT